MSNLTADAWPPHLVSPPAELHAQLYAQLHAGTPGDLDFYRRVCAGEKRVVEFGAGFGRISVALAEAHIPVLGVDYDAPLLSLAAQHKADREQALGRTLPVTFELGDMARFRSKSEFPRVIIPYSGFWCLPGAAAQRACLQAAHACLSDGGVLYLDTYDADGLGEQAEELPDSEHPVVDEFELAHRIEHEGTPMLVFERNVWWPELRRIRVDYQLVNEHSQSDQWRMSVTHHYLLRHELAELLHDCGFDTEWGADESAEGTTFAEQLVVAAFKR